MEKVDLRGLIEEILRDSREMILATSDGSGPWAATLVFGHDQNFNLYWMSRQNTRHSFQLLKNPNVAAVINKQPTGGGQDKGLQIEGKAHELSDEKEIGAAREFFAKRGTPLNLPKTAEEAEPISEDMSWYVLKPIKINIIYEPLFGYVVKKFIP